MSEQAERVDGSCLCGAVGFHVELPTLFCGHCHCTMCQRNHGAAYVTWFGVANEQFAVDKGMEVLVRYESSDHGSRSFCGNCGSSLFCVIGKAGQEADHVDVPLVNMHGPIDKAPQFHIFYDDRAEWVAVGDELPRLGGESGNEPIEG
jgi:hypothetical protein